MRITNKIIVVLFVLFAMKFFIGCGGAEEEVTEDTTAKDSTSIYQSLENARKYYASALSFNEQSDTKSSEQEFESAVNQLSKIDQSKFDKHIFWKTDYNELSKSVVQDYLTSAKDISKNSKVFKLAKSLNIQYEKLESKSYSTEFNPEDLPKGDGIKLVKNESVNEYINYFQNGGKKYMDKWLYRLGIYSNLMRSILKENSAPEELIYLAMIESGLDPTIHSWAGAIGMWQFMPNTGSSYGLYYDSYTDDKRDYEKSTDAAARHLKDLYNSFGDWYLAMASYNAGPGRISSAVERGGSSDFWAIRDYLPKETRNYIPQFIACALISIDPKAYGFNDLEYGKPIEYDRVIIKAQLNVSRIAEMCNSQVETIRDLNPQLLQDVTPVFDDGYLIKIPKGSFKEFVNNYSEATDFDKNNFKPKYEGNEGYASVTSTTTGYKVKDYTVDDPHLIISKSNRNLIFHTFAKSEDLSVAAIKFDVRPSDIRIWNDYPYGRYPKSGDSLSIWITNSKYKEIYGSNVKNDASNSNKIGIKSDNDTKPDSVSKINSKRDSIPKVDTSVKSDSSSGRSKYNNTDIKTTKNDNPNILVNSEHKNGSFNPPITKDVPKTENPSITKDEPKNETVEPKVKQPVESSEEKKVKTTKKEKKETAQIYTVKKGDNLELIANKYDVDISDIKDWNDLSSDKILVGEKLKIYSDIKESADNEKKGKKLTYVVKKGDNLSNIADDYDVTVEKIKDWNDLDNDVIYSGQVLKLYSEKKTTKTEPTGKKSTYTVKEGDNLTLIAEKHNVTVEQIKDWNDLDNDVIYSGQVLKLYSGKQSVKSKETTKLKSQYHLVKKGETLAKIADKYDTTIAEIKKWNKLKSDDITVGQKLLIKN